MQPRDLPAELAHLKTWWATRPSLSPQGVSVEAGRHRNQLPRLLTGERNPTAALLDDFYPMLGKYGYEPLSNEYLFL
jgi:hypothetical protein